MNTNIPLPIHSCKQPTWQVQGPDWSNHRDPGSIFTSQDTSARRQELFGVWASQAYASTYTSTSIWQNHQQQAVSHLPSYKPYLKLWSSMRPNASTRFCCFLQGQRSTSMCLLTMSRQETCGWPHFLLSSGTQCSTVWLFFHHSSSGRAPNTSTSIPPLAVI